MSTPAGWYPTPDGRQRYWDGESWTEHFAPYAPSALPAALPPQMAQQPYVQPYGQPFGQPYPYQVAPKSPGIALLASFFIPGLGSMIVGRGGVGAGILIGYVIGLFFSFILIGLPFVFGFWIWGMVDAYTGAQNWNARHGIIS